MKKIFLTVMFSIALLTACNAQEKKESTPQEIICIDEVGGYKICIASPSGMVLIASGSEIQPYVVDDKIVYIDDYK